MKLDLYLLRMHRTYEGYNCGLLIGCKTNEYINQFNNKAASRYRVLA